MLYDAIKAITDYSFKNYGVPFSDVAIAKDNDLICGIKTERIIL